MSNKVLKNYIYNVAYQVLILLAPLITTPYISRVLGAAGVGVYSYTQSISTYFVLIGAVGTSLYGQREIAYVKNDPQKRTEVFWEISLLRLSSVLIWSIVFVIAFCFNNQYSFLYQILLLEIIATAFDVSWFFMGLEEFRITIIRNILIKLLGIILVFVFVKDEGDVGIYALCLSAPILIGNLSLWRSLPKYLDGIKISYTRSLKHVKPVLILFIPQLALEIYTVLDKTMLGVLSTNIDEVGFYTQASKIIKIALRIVTSLGLVMLSSMSYAYINNKKEVIISSIKKTFKFVYMIGFAIIFGVCGVSKNFVPLFFGNGYGKVALLMIIISPIVVIIGTSNVIGVQYLLPTKQQKLYTTSIISGTIVNFVLNYFLIPKYNSIGASIATVIAELSVTVAQIISVRYQLDLKSLLPVIVKYMICGFIMGIAVYLTGELLGNGLWILLFQVGIGVIIYAIELYLTKDDMMLEALDLLKSKVGLFK